MILSKKIIFLNPMIIIQKKDNLNPFGFNAKVNHFFGKKVTADDWVGT